MSRRAFTVNLATEEMAEQVDYVGTVSGRQNDKFAHTGWSARPADKVDAPYIEECPISLECILSHTLELGVHTMMIGKIEKVMARAACLDEQGKIPDLRKFSPLVYDSGSLSYYTLGAWLGKRGNERARA